MAHFSCGRRERCTFPTSPWPAAASTTSPAPPTAQIHHLYRAPVPSPQTERRASVTLVNEGPRIGPGRAPAAGGPRRPPPARVCARRREAPRRAAARGRAGGRAPGRPLACPPCRGASGGRHRERTQSRHSHRVTGRTRLSRRPLHSSFTIHTCESKLTTPPVIADPSFIHMQLQIIYWTHETDRALWYNYTNYQRQLPLSSDCSALLLSSIGVYAA